MDNNGAYNGCWSNVLIFQEIAASVLSVISFPAFAVEDKELVDLTRDEIIHQLQVSTAD